MSYLTLDSKISINAQTIAASNLCDRFSQEDLDRIGSLVVTGYKIDKDSRERWERRTQAALDLAMQLQKEKTFPWPNCSNVQFPAVTIAALQFHARAYPAIIQGSEVVQMRVPGQDLTGELYQAGNRVSRHMSWQRLEQDKAWEEGVDRALIQIPIVGCVFKKSYYAASKSHCVSDLVSAYDLVINYWAKSVEECPRKTHVIPLYRNDVHTRILRGAFRDIREESWFSAPAAPPVTTNRIERDNRAGVTQPQTDSTTPYTFLEQHVQLDLDQDGYDEPYIITVELTSGCCVRIVLNVDTDAQIERSASNEIISIEPTEYFTKLSFIPSPDGGVYDIGFGVLLGPLNESLNTILNQIVDAGTMSISAGGFLGRGAKIRGGAYVFAPFQWQRVDSNGDDLRKNMVPLPVREPSAVLFQLLSLLIEYCNRVSGATDLMVGETPGQNTPAETSRNALEQGMKIYTAIFKRVWRGMKGEFQKLYRLNGIYMAVGRTTYGTQADFVKKEDYLLPSDAICPVADPNITSPAAKLQQAMTLKQLAASTPGYDPEAVERRVLKAMGVDGIDEVYPGLEKRPPQGKDPKIQIQEMKNQLAMMQLQASQMQFAATLREEQRLNNAKITELQAKAVKTVEDIQGDQQDREINAANTMIGALKHHNDRLSTQIDSIMRLTEMKHEREMADGAGISGVAPPPGE